ncbi:mitotic spindle assembly checkpoint protein mad1 mitotic arrest deficient-like protein [Anaeramoeba ignava]|uniref:Mitotic spindle assembly checkpoint protein mad1 mitotic arrest deficient-like protein n=1 Tax=Anaeramoeba ignava TaxID=1746090 RepID=A0A9Q0L938_ANAIG|nr:mitotic spindle assembly checkpoint protein mad1 mitotic arrest deficient-like protein [Anaeramoeba ignava]
MIFTEKNQNKKNKNKNTKNQIISTPSHLLIKNLTKNKEKKTLKTPFEERKHLKSSNLSAYKYMNPDQKTEKFEEKRIKFSEQKQEFQPHSLFSQNKLTNFEKNEKNVKLDSSIKNTPYRRILSSHKNKNPNNNNNNNPNEKFISENEFQQKIKFFQNKIDQLNQNNKILQKELENQKLSFEKEKNNLLLDLKNWQEKSRKYEMEIENLKQDENLKQKNQNLNQNIDELETKLAQYESRITRGELNSTTIKILHFIKNPEFLTFQKKEKYHKNENQNENENENENEMKI